jgi:spore coat polysaccharide biosynthesis protein SpsF
MSYRDASGLPSIKTHWGVFGEVMRREALERAMSMTNDALYREHVTNFIYTNPDTFKVTLLQAPVCIIGKKNLRFTIDTPEDFNTMRDLYAALNPMDTTLEDLVHHVSGEEGILKNMMDQIIANQK